MKLRDKMRHEECFSHQFNIHTVAPQEIIVLFPDGSADSDYLTNYDALLEKHGGIWMDLRTAFRCKLVVPNDYNDSFYEEDPKEI